MRYLPKSPAEREEMLASIGVDSIEQLFSSIPERYRLNRPLNLPGPFSEAEIIGYFSDRAAENSGGYVSFRGAGVYNHLRSVVTDAIIQRGEFLTSYTPYQAEISQGTLQAIFEFQTLMCQLTGQEVANASMWDGSTATTEAVLMAERLTARTRETPDYRWKKLHSLQPACWISVLCVMLCEKISRPSSFNRPTSWAASSPLLLSPTRLTPSELCLLSWSRKPFRSAL